MKTILFIGAFCLALAGAAFDPSSRSGAAAQTDEPYLVLPGDQLEISVLEDPSLNRSVLVLPDGRVSLPISGTLTAAGLRPEQLAGRIQSRLSSIFVSPPTVTVSVIGLSPGELDEEELPELVFVIGEVRNPGAFPFKQPLNVLQFLAIAGGPGPFAARDRIQIHRKGEDETVTVELFDYEALEEGMGVTPGATLADGDVIIVPERGLFD